MMNRAQTFKDIRDFMPGDDYVHVAFTDGWWWIFTETASHGGEAFYEDAEKTARKVSEANGQRVCVWSKNTHRRYKVLHAN